MKEITCIHCHKKPATIRANIGQLTAHLCESCKKKISVVHNLTDVKELENVR